ncbi:MAG: glycosyltransferase family 4 protein [Nanoarchaeota archaeon]
MKVVILAEYTEKRLNNGCLRHIFNLVENLSKQRGIDLNIVTLSKENKTIKEQNKTIHKIKKNFLPYAIVLLKRKVEQINPDVVHALGGVPYSTISTMLKLPTIWSLLGFIQVESKFYKGKDLLFANLFDKPNERYVLSKSKNIIVQTPNLREIIKKNTKAKIFLLREGFEMMDYNRTIQDPTDIFAFERLVKLKGFDLLIKACKLVVKTFPNLKVYIAGEGEERENIEKLIKELKLEKNIKLLGFIDDRSIAGYFKSCKIVSAPSRWDLDPFSPINARRAGKPSIVTKGANSCIRDGEDGFVIDNENIKQLAEKIIILMGDDYLRKKMGAKALENSKEHNWDNIINNLLNIYKEVINENFVHM